MASSLENTSFRRLQAQLLQWTTSWITHGQSPLEEPVVDMPEIVTLLQVLGFRLRKLNAVDPSEITPLGKYASSETKSQSQSTSKGGVRAVITCTQSGQTSILEYPSKSDDCHCTKVPNESIDSNGNTSAGADVYWEVTSISRNSMETSLVETGSNLLQPISKDLTLFTSNVLGFLCHQIMRSTEIPLKETPISTRSKRYSDNSEFCSPPKSTKSVNEDCIFKSTPVSIRQIKAPSIIVSLPANGATDSPTRYRSLDTLTSIKTDQILPEPGSLVPKGDLSGNSEEHLSVERQENSGSSTSTLGDSSVRMNPNALESLQNAKKLIQSVIDGIVNAKKVGASAIPIKKEAKCKPIKKSSAEVKGIALRRPTSIGSNQKSAVTKSDTNLLRADSKAPGLKKNAPARASISGLPVSRLSRPKTAALTANSKLTTVKSTNPKPDGIKKPTRLVQK